MATSAKKTTRRSASPEAQDATALLHADHEHVSDLLARYETARSSTKKMHLVSEICAELTVHAQVEEEIFYPAVKRALKDYVKHHVKEEEKEMFPKAKSARLDMAELGARMSARKQELVAQRA